MPQLSAVPDLAASSSGNSSPRFFCTLHAGGTLAAWVHVAGELDLVTSRQLERTLREAQLDARLIVLDAREVSFIDSSGVYVIVEASAAAEWGGAQLILIPSQAVDRLLGSSGVRGRVWTLEPDMTDSASELRPPALTLSSLEGREKHASSGPRPEQIVRHSRIDPSTH